jgi:hypothetical protein
VISFVTRGRGERLITTEQLGDEPEVASAAGRADPRAGRS